MEEAKVFGPTGSARSGVIPNEYLYYYYFNRDAVRTINASGETRGDFLAGDPGPTSSTGPAGAGDRAAKLWRETVDARSASYMAEAKGGVQGAPADAPGARVRSRRTRAMPVCALGVMAGDQPQRAGHHDPQRAATRHHRGAARPTRWSKCRPWSTPTACIR